MERAKSWLGGLCRRVGVIKDEGEAGQGLAEYALILALVALACVAGVTALGGAIASSSAWTIP